MTLKSFHAALCCGWVLSAASLRKAERQEADAHSKQDLPDTLVEMINKLQGPGYVMDVAKDVTKRLAEDADKMVAFLGATDTCSSEWNSFSFDDLKKAISNNYKKKPFSCSQGSQVQVDGVLELFGQRARATKSHAGAKYVVECILQDMVDKYGGEGLSWDTSGLSKFPGLRSTLSAYYAELTDLGVKDIDQWDNMTFRILSANFQKYGMAYQGATGAQKNYLYEYLKKLFLISVGPQMVHRFRNSRAKLEEVSPYRPALLAANIEWAVDFENLGVQQGHPAADPENVELGRKVMQLYGHCINYFYDQSTPHLRMEAYDDLLDHAVLLYTIWNYRYVTYFTTQNPAPAMCPNGHKWSVVPSVAAHSVVSLIGSLNEAGDTLTSWSTYRPISLMMAGGGIEQSCSGETQAAA